MTRTPQDIFTDHLAAVASGDPQAIVGHYSDDAVLVTVDGALQGHEAIREFFSAPLGALPEAQFSMGSTVFAGDAVLVQWSADSPDGRIRDAVDTLLFANGKIRLQTTVFHMEPPGAG